MYKLPLASKANPFGLFKETADAATPEPEVALA
jgi:hypothetical protein